MWAYTLAIKFWIPPLARCQVGILRVSDNYPIGAKQNVSKHASALHLETLEEDGQTFFIEGTETPKKPVKKKEWIKRRIVAECANGPSSLSMEQEGLVVFPHKIWR